MSEFPKDGCTCPRCELARLASTPAPATCATCTWFTTRFGYDECHRHAPAPNALSRGDLRVRIFPIVSDTDSCGDHAPKDSK